MSVDLQARLKAVSELVSENGLLQLVEMVWSTDRPFTFPAFHTTARHVSAKLREWGVRARTFEIPADGKTLYGNWKMPLGWDCTEARLEIHDPFEERGRVLADSKKRPAHVVMWSGPTPAEGIVAPLLKVTGAQDLEAKREAVKGKIVFTTENPRAFKKRLAELGARAVVTSWSRNAHLLPSACFWINGWSDNPNGWAFHDGDTPLPGMVISPESGVELDVLLDRGPVKLRIKVASRYMESTLPVVCGYMDAPLQEEILAIGHAMEQGANDNASGCAVILESLRVLQEGTKSGQLAPLRRAVRGLLTNECYGTMGFAALNPGIVRRILAGVNFDSLGRCQEGTDAAFRHHRCPDASASVADTLMALLLEAWLPKQLPYLRLAKDQPFALTDNHYCDPQLGVHCVYVDSQDRFWHTSADTLDQLSGRSLHAFATISVAYLHFLSTATAPEALWLAQQTLRRYGRQMEDHAGECASLLDQPGADKPALLASAFDRLDYLKTICESAVMSSKRFMLREERAQGHLTLLKYLRHLRRLVDLEKRRLKELAGCEPGTLPAPPGLGDLAALRPYRKFIGTPTYDHLPLEAKAGIESPVWNGALHGALFWSDGKLTFAEIVRRINHEFGGNRGETLARHFRFMAENELLQWLQPGEAIPKPPKPDKKDESHAGTGMEEPAGVAAGAPDAAAEPATGDTPAAAPAAEGAAP